MHMINRILFYKPEQFSEITNFYNVYINTVMFQTVVSQCINVKNVIHYSSEITT